MIERTHLEAYRIAAKRAAKAADEGRFEEAEVYEKQMVAIRELETQRKEIFARYGVQDIALPTGSKLSIEFRPGGTPTSRTFQFKEEYQPEELQDFPFRKLFAYFRVNQGLTQRAIADQLHLTTRTMQRAERGESFGMITLTRVITESFGWDIDDWRAQLLLQKAQEARNTPTQR